MKIILFIALGIVVVATGFGMAWQSQVSNVVSRDKPNVLFLIADDMGYDAIRAFGNFEIHTPNLDRLVEHGTSFTAAYNMGAWQPAVCIASRSMLNTGRSVWNAGYMMRDPNIDPEAPRPIPRGATLDQSKFNFDTGGASDARRALWGGEFWSLQMKAAGYDTYFSGKWHVDGAVLAPLFDVVRYAMPGGMPPQTQKRYDRGFGPGEEDSWKAWDTSMGGHWMPDGKHRSEHLSDCAKIFLEEAAGRDKPFFMYLAFNAPHDPRQSPERFVNMYPLENIETPKSFVPENPYAEAMGCGPGLRDERLAPFPRTEYAVKINRQEYYAIITHMDEQIGRILDNLESTGQASDTYIVFTTDHGLSVGKHGLIGKQSMYEHSIRVPLIICGPGIPKNQRIDGNVYLQDIVPTTLEWAGADIPSFVYFNSLLPLIRGDREHNYENLYGCYAHKQRMVRSGDWKLIAYPEAEALLLYNLKEDPEELIDRSNDPNCSEIKKELFRQLLELQSELNDPLDISGVYKSLLLL